MPKLPPYGKFLFEKICKEGRPKNDIYLFVGTQAFKKAKEFQISRPGTLALPAYECPSQYFWPVNGCDILIFDTGYCETDYLNDLAYYLYQHHANIVRCVLPDFTIITFDK